jgi:hypothetical protein
MTLFQVSELLFFTQIYLYIFTHYIIIIIIIITIIIIIIVIYPYLPIFNVLLVQKFVHQRPQRGAQVRVGLKSSRPFPPTTGLAAGASNMAGTCPI